MNSNLINVDIFIGCAPLLEIRLCEGLLKFGQTHPQWRFNLRNGDFRYTREMLDRGGITGVLALIEASPVEHVLDEAGIPWVHLLPGRPVEHANVTIDDYAIGRMGADYFLEKGFLKCSFCGVGTLWSALRANGFLDRMTEAGRSASYIDVPFQTTDWGISPDTDKDLVAWLDSLEKGLAIMAGHDALANRLVDLCMRRGWRLPQDIAIMGVGNHDMLCKLSPVPITSIDAAVPEVAIRGAAMLEDLLNGKQQPNVVVPPLGVEERRSTDILDYGDDLVARVVGYIRDNASEGITVKDLLKVFPVSQRTLTRRFDKYVGHSPAVEIRKTRLRLAKQMLKKTSKSLTEIAFACGYADLPHMDRSFRELEDCTPGDFRRQLQ